jgi:hypothetical protein
MTTWARVENDVVRELFDLPAGWAELKPADLFDPGLGGDWLDVTTITPKPEYGWVYDGKSYAPPPEPEDGEARTAWARKLGYRV